MSQQSIKRSIEATDKIRKITKAMQLVSVNHLTRAASLERNGKPYLNALLDIINHWMLKHEEKTHPYFKVRELKTQLVIIYGSDKGLCASLNLNTIKMALEQISSDQERGVMSRIITIGDKPLQFLSRRFNNIEASIHKLGMHIHIEDLAGIINILMDGYLNDRWQKVVLIYPKFINTMTQTPTMDVLLPLESEHMKSSKTSFDAVDYIYEPSVNEVLDKLLQSYIDTQVYQAALETLASEQAARMVAMQNATENAESCKHELEIKFHKIRQAVITREIAEITSGAQASN